MTQSIALPRRRRRKPPRPQFWARLFLVAWEVLGALACIYFASPVNLVTGGGFLLLLALRDWPAFIHELELWRDDE